MASFLADRAPLATVEELAAYFRTGKDWIEKGCQNRTLPFVRRGKSYGFTPEQVEEIIRIRSVEPKRVPTRDEVADRRATRGRRVA